MPGVSIKNLGCRVNRVEADDIALELEARGIPLVPEDDASLIVINTCAVTGEAEAKTRKALRHAAQLPQKPLVIACGCAAVLFSSELQKLSSSIVIEKDTSRVASRVIEELGDVSSSCELPQMSVTPTGRTRPGIKIQDGCNNRCSFCLVWKARGTSRSKPFSEIQKELNAALSRGAQEIVLTGINVGTYYDARVGDLAGLIEHLLETTDVGRLRISSIEPPDVTERLLKLMQAAGERVAPFLHICLQSGSETVLTRMKRNYTAHEYAERVSMARDYLPELSLGCDLIVGFPGETEDEFEESYAFAQRMNFSHMHVFRYSLREGTEAALMQPQVDSQIMNARSERMRLLAYEMRHSQAQKLIGTTQLVLVQGKGRGVTGGLFECAFTPTCADSTLVPMRVTSVFDSSLLLCELLPST